MHALLRDLFRTAFTLAAAATVLTCQLQIRGSKALRELVGHTRAVLADNNQAPRSAHDLTRLVFARLRLGELDAARSLLRAYERDEDPGLVLAAHATFLRTTGELVFAADRQRRLERALTRAEQARAKSYCSAALLVHGRYCLGQICDGDTRVRHEQLATTRLLALEGETWQPGRGHYRPTPCNGELCVPQAADASLLVPHSFGMLIASGNRLTRHLKNTLKASHSQSRHRWRPDVSPEQLPALQLIAAAQLGDRAQIAPLYNEVIRQRPDDASLAALNLDAVLQAVSGVRLAAGAGLSERWLRMKPWLPTDCTKLELQGLWAQQHRFGVTLQHELQRELPRERTEAVTIVEVMLEHPEGAQLSLVVANCWQQFVTTVSGDQPFRCALPNQKPLPTNPKTNHDALHRFGFRAR
ncbi:MAG TPA: hypothetical protein EYP98_11535 [Planctomycetes bacterium]|nr:hypothetical protein [Planctomycetota bacterium]